MIRFLKIPDNIRDVDDALGTAKHLCLPNVVILSELESGDIVLIHDNIPNANINWLLDRVKSLLISPANFEKSQG